uniref:Neurogenic differentiation 1 isoform 2 n=1 Tax=Homo sapiens TaxID=9606 RepID=A0A0S2Z4S1_HUMAN|nr:neurogenic differentiation 1 isoform 2 [Homo sapiens]
MTKSYSESGLMGEPQPQGPPSWTDECLSSQDEEHEADKKEDDLETMNAEEDSLRNGGEEEDEDEDHALSCSDTGRGPKPRINLLRHRCPSLRDPHRQYYVLR